MLRGVVLGATLGILGAATGMVALMIVEPLLRGGTPSTGTASAWAPLVLIFTAVYAGPGAVLLSLPLFLLLRARAHRGTTRGNLLVLALTVGALAGVLNLFGTTLAMSGFRGLGSLVTAEAGLWFTVPALTGGLGLGWGCFLGLPAKERHG